MYMKKQFLLMFALLLAVTQMMAVGVITVGSSGATYTDLQTAVTNAATGDEIHIITPGVYPGVVLNSAKNLTVKNMASGTVEIQGASPALTVSAGFISFSGVSFYTATNDPTILITGGKLELRYCVVSESAGFNQAGVYLSGGELDAGTLTTPGHNSFGVNGAGKAVVNNGGIANAIRNYWGSDFYMQIAPTIQGNVAWDPWCNSTFTNCNLSVYGGPITTIPKIVIPCGTATTVDVPVYADQFANIDAISLTIDYWPGTIQFTGYTADVAFPGMTVIANNTTGKAIIGWFGSMVASFPNNVPMVVLHFNYSGGSSYLNFNDANIVDCEYQNALIQYPYADEVYNDGWVTDLGGMVLGSTNVICYGTQSGTISITGASCGSGLYEYSIDGGATWQSTNTYNVYAGTYNVWIRDANFPTVKIQLNPALVIQQPAAPFSLTAYWTKRVRCKGESNGEATAFPVGGWGGYSYLWSDPMAQTTAKAVGLAAGWYTVTVTDAGGCSITLPVNVIEPLQPFQASVTPIPVSCKGSATGGFTVNAANGWGYYMYSIDMINYWSYLTSNTVTGLPAGNYTIHIFDDERCELFLPLTIPEPAVALTANAVVTQNVSCYGFADGVITASANGGWSGYQFSIDNGATWQPSPVFSGLIAGTYTVMVKDLYNCIITLSPLTVTQPPYFGTTISGNNTICYGFSTPLTFSSTGGVAPYTLVYTDGATNYTVGSIAAFPVVINVSPGTTTTYALVSVTDANGCPSLVSGSALINVNPLPQLGFSFNGNLAGTGTVFDYCYNETVTVNLSNIWVGTAPFNIAWTVNGTPNSATGVNLNDILFSSTLAPGSYVVQITSIVDANGCSPVSYVPYTATAVVHPEPAVGFSINGVLAGTGSIYNFCYNETVTATLSNNWVGTAPYTIAWTVNGTPASATGVNVNDILFSNILAPGQYVVQVTSIIDANGCSPASYAPYTLTVNVHPEPAIGFSINGVLAGTGSVYNFCYNETVTATLSNNWVGTAPFNIAWTVNGVPASATGVNVSDILFSSIMAPGQYVVQVTSIIDANGCSPASYAPYTLTVNVHPKPAVTDVQLSTSVDLINWSSVGGSFSTNYVMCIDPVIPFHYMDINTFTMGANPLMQNNLNPFYLNTSSLPTGFYAYWAAKGVVYGATGWQGIMWDIINGNAPMLYINYNGSDYTLIDGLQYLAGSGMNALRISGDYPQGLYTFTGSVTDINGCVSDPFSISIQLNSSPVVTDVTLQASEDLLSWNPVAGTFTYGYELCLDKMAPYHYLDINTLNVGVNSLLTTGFTQNAFYLNTGSVPGNFYAYWAAKGVVSGATGWQGVMWNIINGVAPMYYINYDGVDYTLVDGLQYQIGSGVNPLRISGDYPAGNYIFTGTVADVNGCVSSPFSIQMALKEKPMISFGFNNVEAGHNASFEYCYDQPVEVKLFAQYAGVAPYSVTYTINGGTPVTVTGLYVNDVIVPSQIYPAGTYNIVVTNITSANGCNASPAFLALCQATVTINPEPAVGFSFNGVLAATGTIFDYCYTTPVTVTLSHIWAGYAPFTVTYTVDNGSGPVTSTVTGLNLGGTLFSGLLAPGTYQINVTGIVDAKGCSPANYQPYTATVNIYKVDLDGYYTYHNTANTPLNNITVNISGPAGNYTAITDATGYYKFQGICPGTYEVISTTIKPVGSINSTDAVQVNSWGVNYATNPIEKVRFKAGDVALNYGFMDMGDAISILIYFTNGGSPAFSPNWVFWPTNDITQSNPTTLTANPYITVGNINLAQDFYGMVSADFNRSFTPGNAKLGNTMNLNHQGSVLVEKSQELLIPVTVESAMNITAASLILNYPADKLEILGVEMQGTNAPVMFTALNGTLRIGYADLNALHLNAGDVLLTLRVRTTQNLVDGDILRITMTSDPLNELADASFEPVPGAVINIPVLEYTTGINNTPSEGTITLSNRPNPFNGTTTLNYLIPAAGNVEITLFDLYGRIISTVENSWMSAGQHQTMLDISHLNSGVYMVALRFSDGSAEQVRSLRIINQH